MGFYPVNPADGVYVIGSPAFDKLTVNIGNGKTFTVIASNLTRSNKYIQSVTINGKKLETFYITHKDIMNGGILKFEMGEKPNKELWTNKH